MREIAFLGHRLGHGELAPIPETLEKIVGSKRPTNKKQLRSFLGLTGYYRQFIPNYVEKALPLVELTKQKEPNMLRWTSEQENAFQELQRALSAGPILRAPDFTKQFVLRTDASESCLGAMMMQEHMSFLHPVAYASRNLLPREKNYATIEKEALALVWAILKFHVYLYGREFKVQTDHQPLEYLHKMKAANSRILRWSLLLQEYQFSVRYIKGVDNVGADYLSRV